MMKSLAGLVLALLLSARTPWAHDAFMITLPYLVLYIGLLKLPSLSKFARYGDFSYGIYLYAFLVQQSYMAVIGDAWGFWPFMLISWCVTLLCAVASWYLIERPCLALKKQRLASSPATVFYGHSA